MGSMKSNEKHWKCNKLLRVVSLIIYNIWKCSVIWCVSSQYTVKFVASVEVKHRKKEHKVQGKMVACCCKFLRMHRNWYNLSGGQMREIRCAYY